MVMGTGYNPRIVTDGLVFCLDAANARSYPGAGTTWTDLKGGNNSTLANSPSFDPNNAGSIVFDGSNQRSQASLPSSLGSTFTLECFGRFHNSSRSNYEYFGAIGEWYGGSSRNMCSIARIGTQFSNSAHHGKLYLNGTGIIVDLLMDTTDWLHIVVTANGGTPTAYKNGTPHTSYSVSTDLGAFNVTNIVMTAAFKSINVSTYGWYLDGQVSCQRVYNRALTADEVRQNYLATKERYA